MPRDTVSTARSKQARGVTVTRALRALAALRQSVTMDELRAILEISLPTAKRLLVGIRHAGYKIESTPDTSAPRLTARRMRYRIVSEPQN